MLARERPSFLTRTFPFFAGILFVALATFFFFFLFFGGLAQAQVGGVPPSVTSMGFGGNNSPGGVRPGVTSLGPITQPYNWTAIGNCCATFFLPPNMNAGAAPGNHHHRRDRDHDRGRNHDNGGAGRRSGLAGGDVVYVPYAVPYAPELDDDSLDEDSAADSVASPEEANTAAAGHAAGAHVAVAIQRAPVRDYVAKAADAGGVREPVAPQRLTVLIFKDGHQSDVVNYAIVGPILFDFSSGRTHKIPLTDLDLEATHRVNEDRGVDFQIPALRGIIQSGEAPASRP